MPLLISPIDGSPMKQINRYGVEIDVCPTTGGIWLDKGELEKLMALLKEEAINEQDTPTRSNQEARRARLRDYDDEDDDDLYEQGRNRKGKKSRMMDFFDF